MEAKSPINIINVNSDVQRMCDYFYCNCNYCNSSYFAMSRSHIEKIWKNLNRGVHFFLFLPLYLLITSNLRCVYPPPETFLSIDALWGGGVHASLYPDCQGIIPKNGQKCTPLFKNSREKIF